jgi:hypothetical protein
LKFLDGLTASDRGAIPLASYGAQKHPSASRRPRAEHRRNRAISNLGHSAESVPSMGPGAMIAGRKPAGPACRASRRPASTDGRVDRFATHGPNRRTCDVALGRSLRS